MRLKAGTDCGIQCMNSGLKNLQTASKAASRKQRLSDVARLNGGLDCCDSRIDDSGVVLDEEDLEDEFDSENDEDSYDEQHNPMGEGMHMQRTNRMQYSNGQRLPSTDMGIAAIINRPGRG
jgi:hypothetical protein